MISKSNKERLATEFGRVAQLMADSDSADEELYFFTAVWAEIQRVLNWQWDDDLCLLHQISQTASQTLGARLNMLQSGSERHMKYPTGFFSSLTPIVSKLANLFSAPEFDSKEFSDLLISISRLSYMATGNGYYLLSKGQLIFDAAPDSD